MSTRCCVLLLGELGWTTLGKKRKRKEKKKRKKEVHRKGTAESIRDGGGGIEGGVDIA